MFSFELLWDISILFGLIAVVLIMYTEFISPYYGKANMRLNRKRLNLTALLAVSIFLVLMGIRVFTTVTK